MDGKLVENWTKLQWTKLQADLAAFRPISDVLGKSLREWDGIGWDAFLRPILYAARGARENLSKRRKDTSRRDNTKPVERLNAKLRASAEKAIRAWMPRKSYEVAVEVGYPADYRKNLFIADFRWRRTVLDRGLAVVSDCFVVAILEEWIAPEGHAECKVLYLDRKLSLHRGWMAHRDGKLASLGKTQDGVRRAAGRRAVAHVKDIMINGLR